MEQTEQMKRAITAWLDEVCRENTIPGEIVALNFGIYETEPQGFCLYMSGACSYDEDDDDWACDTDFEPKQKCVTVQTGMDWQEFLSAAASIVSDYVNGPQRAWFGSRIVTVGFDDGELQRVN